MDLDKAKNSGTTGDNIEMVRKLREIVSLFSDAVHVLGEENTTTARSSVPGSLCGGGRRGPKKGHGGAPNKGLLGTQSISKFFTYVNWRFHSV